MTGLAPGVIRHTKPSRSAVTHTDPPPTAMPGQAGIADVIGGRARFVRGSIGVTAPASFGLMNQTPSRPAAIR